MQSSLYFIPFPTFPDIFSFHERQSHASKLSRIELPISEWAFLSYVCVVSFLPTISLLGILSSFLKSSALQMLPPVFTSLINPSMSPRKVTCFSFLMWAFCSIFESCLNFFFPWQLTILNRATLTTMLTISLFSTSISGTSSYCWPLITLPVLSYVTSAFTKKAFSSNIL